MKSIILNNPRPILLAGLMLLVSSLGWAQKTSGDISLDTSTAVRVIDNKGTIKYLQSSNGITTLTNSTANVTTTTWQLGGSLDEDVNITTGAKEFKLTLDDGSSQGTFVIDGVVQETGSAATSSTLATSGYTLLVRDENTGAVKKLLATDILQGGHHVEVLTGDKSSDLDISVTGVSTDYEKVSVYRNGAKLVGGDTSSSWINDYSVTTNQVTINLGGTGELSALYTNDVIEVHWVK